MSGYPRTVYLLDPKELSAETIAVTFAKTSRSPESFREIAAELSDAKSAEFNEKWVVGYGHSSVAEHAILHVAIENISRLAVEVIQSSRLASFTEKSTRYQAWSADAYYTPSELSEGGFLDEYQNTCRMLFETYERAIGMCMEVAKEQCPRQEGESKKAYERRLLPLVVDACRFLLPASSLANLGMTINAREIEHLISKMLSHPLAEVRKIGCEVKDVSQAEVPTLVKYADRNLYQEQLHKLHIQQPGNYYMPEVDFCQLKEYSLKGEENFLAAVLYRYSMNSYLNCLDEVLDMSDEEKMELAEKSLGMMGQYDWPLREAEHVLYTFDLMMDQGGYYEMKRHRMMTQSPQELSCLLGYDTPQMIEQAGFASEYGFAMDAAAILYGKIAEWDPYVAGYIVPNGFRRRVLVSMNFREAYNFIQLRSAPGAHFSIRRIAQKMAEQINAVHPILGRYLRKNEAETWQSICDNYFTE